MKIVIPGHPDKKAMLAGDIVKRASQDGELSPIKVLISKDISDKIEAIQQKTKQANEFRRQSEVLIEERDRKYPYPAVTTRSKCGSLLKLYCMRMESYINRHQIDLPV